MRLIFLFTVNPPPLVNPTLERKLPFSISSSSFPQIPFPSDSSSIPQQPSPQNLSSQRKQIYDNPGIARRLEQPSSTTITHESHSLMPPPPPPRDLSKKPLPAPCVSLESQLMPPPKVIPGGETGRAGHASVDGLAPPDSMRISSRYLGAGHHKEDIGKRETPTMQPHNQAKTWSTNPLSTALGWAIFSGMNLLHF